MQIVKREELRDAIINRIDLLDYAESLASSGLIPNFRRSRNEARSDSFIEPHPHSKTDRPVAYKYNNSIFWKDHRTGEAGTVIELSAIVNHNGNVEEAIEELKKRANIQLETNIGDTKQNFNINNVERYHEDLLNKHHQVIDDFLASRGISEQDVKKYKLGICKYKPKKLPEGVPENTPSEYWLTIPFLDEYREPVYISYRFIPNYITNKEISVIKPDTNYRFEMLKYCPYLDNRPLFGLNTIPRSVSKRHTLYVSEGMFDGLTLIKSGYNVLSACNADLPQDKEKFLNIARSYYEVVVILDNDPTGIEKTIDYVEWLLDNGIYNVSVVTVPKSNPDDKKADINEYYTLHKEDDPKLKKMLKDNKIDALTYLAKQELDKPNISDYLQKLVKKHYRKKFMTKHIRRLLANVKEWADDEAIEYITQFDYSYLDKLFSTEPTQEEIEEEVLAEHDLIYHSVKGFKEYVDGIWINASDNKVKSYINEKYGRFKKGRLTSQVLSLIQADANDDNLAFNTSPVMVFKNSTLDLITGETRPHNINDYMTVKLSYDYQPKDKPELWLKTISEIMGNDQTKINTLQEILGYTLFDDNSLDTISFFIGDGSNGKSLVLKVMEQVIGADNCVAINIDNLTCEFERQRLDGAMLNVSGEINPYLKKINEILKRIASGDKMSASKKGKDFYDFIPRTKIIACCNKMPQTNGRTYGDYRKFSFLNFGEKYVSQSEYDKNPDYQADPHVHVKDPNLYKKLLKELSGIFNWIYEGYLRLKKNGDFTWNDESDKLKNEFIANNNNVIYFYEENYSLKVNPEPYNVLPNEGLYQEYVYFCESAREKPLKRRNFLLEFKPLFLKEHKNYKNGKIDHNTRGLIKED